MEQFSHDLTLALEETSRCGETKHRWGMRRRTRSTGNLPCAPQPTEDSSSSPADQLEINTSQNSPQLSGANNHIQSDSDDRHALAFAFRSRQTPHMPGNFESDSFNENFSPARPNIRRKRKFKRMAVGYEPTLSTTAVSNSSIFPAIVKKRAFNHETLRSSLFFCGKRKRSHRDRYFDYETYKQHSSSVPRQRDLFSPKSSSYLEGKTRNRAASFSSGVSLNRSIISKIEKMSQTSDRNLKLCFQFSTPSSKKVDVVDGAVMQPNESRLDSMCCSDENEITSKSIQTFPTDIPALILNTDNTTKSQTQTLHSTKQKTNSLEPVCDIQSRRMKSKRTSKSHKVKQNLKQEMMQVQFDDRMSCNLSDLLSSSSLSSSDSETVNTNESDHEGDDELTDWPGNEGMVNFASKNDFKRANKTRVMKPSLPQIKQQDDIQDDDTLMSTDDNVIRKLTSYDDIEATAQPSHGGLKYSPGSSEDLPLDQQNSVITITGHPSTSRVELNTEGPNDFFPSQDMFTDIREIRAGCRRIREERPSFSIISSANELLARFLQNDQQQVLTLFDINTTEHEKLFGLSKLYSLTMQLKNGCVILSKTSNTMQSVRVDHTHLPKSIADFKRRCYGDTEDLHLTNLPE
ncbi:uncharacterized protein LOC5568991 [Aedes aegypti]|uniref:Uncharacterized protein n=1 Tax=Aedes aegypti TaxID=7159 RepID=A0A6I8T9W2_AEDAE|nr:uncharacterized protein LOC5568991 [Aedes aegypti]XP_021709575.1 uncharacterized protein LOC5568991 [Aedes aegypti]